MRWVVAAAFVLVLAVTVSAVLPFDHWFFTGSDFFRVHLVAIGVAGLGLAACLADVRSTTWGRVGAALVAAAVVYHATWIFPFTTWASLQVHDARPVAGSTLSLLVANVHRDNRRHEPFVELVRDRSPDVVAVLECDAWWCERLARLDDAWPHVVEVPLDNTYGMALRSAVPLVAREVEYLVEEGVPSIHVTLEVAGRRVRVVVVHPRPPTPGGAREPSERDAELMIVARRTKDDGLPTVVVGDLNAVAWSPTTRRFQRLAGLLDPRIGRGFFTTWHADWALLRFPIDHVFHSQHFGVARLEVCDVVGSDHRAMFAELVLSERMAAAQVEPDASAEDRAEARETIEDGTSPGR